VCLCCAVPAVPLHRFGLYSFTCRVEEAGEYSPAGEHADSVRALINVIKKEETLVHIDLGAKVPVS
jgi:hypothetical protein